MKKLLPTLIIIFLFSSAYSQNVGIGTSTPDNSAALEIKDNSKGILIPRMTMAERNNIQNPAEGLMVYQTDSTKGFWYYDGNQWKNVAMVTTTGSISLSDPRTLIYTTSGF